MHLTEIPQLQRATPVEKIELIDELWASIPPEAVSTPDSHLKELEAVAWSTLTANHACVDARFAPQGA